MAGRRFRPKFDPEAGLKKLVQEPAVHAQLLKAARASGQLNLSSRHLSEVPACVWRINLEVPEEARTVSLDNTEDRWWEQTDLTKLILASNVITSLSEEIINLPALTVLDVHDNKLTNLPRALGKLENLQRLNLSHNEFTNIPDCIGHLSRLSILQLQHNKIQEVGPHVGDLMVLEELDLSNNQIRELPRDIGYLTKLFKLNISNNHISEVPLTIGDISSLRMLDCTHNQLTELPRDLGRLSLLEQLYLRHNKIPTLPVLYECTKLKEIHLGNNALKELTPQHLAHLRNVTVLDVRDNKISLLPDEIVLLEGLQRLDVTNNNLSTLPLVLGKMVNLKSIVLDGNPMKSIRRDIIMRGTNELKKYLSSRMAEPEASGPPVSNVQSTGGTSGIIGGGSDGINTHDVGVSKTLDFSDKKVGAIPQDVWEIAVQKEVQKINLSKNAITSWPSIFPQLAESLRELDLGFNRIPTVDSGIGQLHQLVFLDLRNNLLSDLPSEVAQLPCLREIILSFNRFKKIPASLHQCDRLEIILASDNQIEDLDPEALKSLSRLATLDLTNNNLIQVPPTLGLVTQLRSLQLEGNPFRMPRPAVLARGTNAILEYLQGRIPQ